MGRLDESPISAADREAGARYHELRENARWIETKNLPEGKVLQRFNFGGTLIEVTLSRAAPTFESKGRCNPEIGQYLRDLEPQAAQEGPAEVRELDGRDGWQQPEPINERDARLTVEQVCGLAFAAAGAGSGAVMSKEGLAGEVVMPTEEISGRVRELLTGVGIDLSQVRGYGGAVEESSRRGPPGPPDPPVPPDDRPVA